MNPVYTRSQLDYGVADTSLVVREHHTFTQDCQNLIDEQANTESIKPTVQIPVVQSGSLTFKKAPSPNPTKTVYEVFHGVESLSIIVKDTEGLWSNSCDSDGTLQYATPHEALLSVSIEAELVFQEGFSYNEENEMVLWIGGNYDEVSTVEKLQNGIESYATIPKQVLDNLSSDRANTPQTTRLQQMARKMMTQETNDKQADHSYSR